MSDMPLLFIRDLSIGTSGLNPVPIVKHFELVLPPKERLAIVGESGSGKSLSTKAVTGLLPQGVQVTGGSIRYAGDEIIGASETDLRRIRGNEIGMVFQDPMTSLNPAMKIGQQLAEGLRLHTDLSMREIRERSVAMLARVKMHDPEGCLERYPHEFSGGMRQRIMLASVFLLKPRLLIADEPTTALDTLSQREVLEIMVELTEAEGTALLLITHDLGLVAQYTRKVLVMERGVVVERGETESVLRNPQHPYTQKLVSSLPRPRELPEAAPSGDPLLRIRGLEVRYPSRGGLFTKKQAHNVLGGVDLDLREGEIVALVGASGSGKTTMGRAVLGLAPVTAGKIFFDGADVAAMSAEQRAAYRRDIQLVFQDPYSSLDPRMRIRSIVAAPLRTIDGLTVAERTERVAAMLKEVGLEGFGDRFPHQLSGGQRQRVAIARAIVSRPRLVVADEPVSALDLSIQAQVLDLLRKLQEEQGFACLFITHDMAVVEQIADRVVTLEGGSIVEQGPTAAVFECPRHDYTRELLAATPGLALRDYR